MRFADHFRAMDTDIDVDVECPGLPLALSGLREVFAEQEARFSRFRADSHTSRLNAGESVTDPMFAAVCRLALEAHDATGGLFNPLILPALAAAGYGRTFSEVTEGAAAPRPVPDPNAALAIDGNTVRLLHGAIDFGGIVKGWTVDEALGPLRDEADAALVNAGGDLACYGAFDGPGWEVGVAAPGGAIVWSGDIVGALATSTTQRRRWRTTTGGIAHHLIDPRTGLPSASEFVQVSARAGQAWYAEVWAKAALIGGRGSAALAVDHGVSLLSLTAEGRVETWGEWPGYSRPDR